MGPLDNRHFRRIDPLAHRQTTLERYKGALCIFGGAAAVVLAFIGILAAFFIGTGLVS